MKVVFVTHSYPPYIGGVQYVVEQMAAEIAKRNHEGEVFTLKPFFAPFPHTEKVNGYTVRRFFGISPSNAYFIPLLSFINALVKIQADVLHVHVVHSLVPFAVFLAKKFHPHWKIVVLTPHFHDVGFSWHTNLAWTLYRPFLKKIIRPVDIIHSISPKERKLLKERLGVDSVLIPHGVSADTLNYKWSPSGVFTVIYSGQLMEYKRVGLLVEARSIINKTKPNAQLLVIGNGPQKIKLKMQAKKLGANVHFISPLSRKNYLAQIAASSVMCYLSESEAFCITALEAIAIGTPVVLVQPWGSFFKKYSRVIVLSANPTPQEVSNALSSLIRKDFPTQDKVPAWSDVVVSLEQLYIAKTQLNSIIPQDTD
jgi:glycosyltransferase involved in cell wall biosynthesis